MLGDDATDDEIRAELDRLIRMELEQYNWRFINGHEVGAEIALRAVRCYQRALVRLDAKGNAVIRQPQMAVHAIC